MPIYEYQCQSCEYEFEALQKISDAALTDCPECANTSLKKKVSAAGFRLSGSGWYETDFKQGRKSNIKTSDNDSKSGTSTSHASSPADKTV